MELWMYVVIGLILWCVVALVLGYFICRNSGSISKQEDDEAFERLMEKMNDNKN